MKIIFNCLFFLTFSTFSFAQEGSIQKQLQSLSNEKDPIVLKQKLESYVNSKQENGIIVAVNYYNRTGMRTKADSLKLVAIKKFPKGDFSYSNAIEKLNATSDYNEQLKFARTVSTRFSDRDLSILYGKVANEAAKNKDCRTIKDAIDKIKDQSYRYYVIPSIAETLLTAGERNTPCIQELLQQLLKEYKSHLSDKMIKEQSPNFLLPDLKGNQVSLASLKGKTVIIDFWATWCKPCLESFPGMQRAVERHKNDEKVVFVFLNTAERGSDDPKPRIEKLLTDHGYTFTVLMDRRNAEDKKYEVSNGFGVTALPSKYIIDKEGFIRFKIAGSSGGPAFINEEIKMIVELLNN
ncbi:thiol-disulfide isomerase/thioredoxin [Pedobacter africanus]|uniref:Thiol-disulfide isomerase/thioredoxin n=1 Tax=Pedobacter africanus TaxID=151894 RepID=A0ACC6KW72_9SPHI|nr:TlpA disulfide reductase family protein [Pedobacter africanus]MDR6783383.1 thiol-disulfide isomerase/thioredoxin [Pedobacter africanus]